MSAFIAFLLLFNCWSNEINAQSDSSISKPTFFESAKTFNKSRFWTLSAIGAVGYTGVVIGLDRAWYANYARGDFHFFDDWAGWDQMDKMGHAMTGYFESKWAGSLYKWAGLSDKEAPWVGFGVGILFQSTLEIMDGFSEKWGFSWADMGFNVMGSGLYLGQELLWKEQRILLKMSSHRPTYSDAPLISTDGQSQTTLQTRANDLFGSTVPEIFFKEYNGQTIWLSVNIASFMKNRPHLFPPKWLNIAVGYGIENFYGAESNSWTDQESHQFDAPADLIRHRQFYLSLDIDFEKIPTRHKWLKTIFSFLNVFKVPFPTMEINTLGQVKFHPFYF